MNNITPFKPKSGDADLIFVCQCGCATFKMRGDGAAECSGCEKILTDIDGGHWWSSPQAPAIADEPPVNFTAGNGDGGRFAELSAKRKTNDADWIICGTIGGNITSWSREFIETDDQELWLRSQTDLGLTMILSESNQ